MVLKNFMTLLICFFSISASAQQFTLKFATLIPPDTAWMNEINHWAETLEKQSNGRLTLKIYPGGIMGDEPDVLRKIRSQQLHGAFFTGYGIGRIFSPARVLEVPFLFKNTNESDYVRQHLMSDIEKGFLQNEFVLLGWPEVGFIHFFSKKEIASLQDLKTHRIWLWQGDPLGEAFAHAAGVSPIPLSIIDVYGQLSASYGSIDTVYNSPFGALALQWHSKLSYASNIPMTNAIGSLVVSKIFFDQLPNDLQTLLKSSGKATGDNINQVARRDNEESIKLLKQSGIKFMWDWNPQEQQELLSIRDAAAQRLADSNYIPPAYFERTRKLLDEFRKTQSTQ